MKMTYQEADRKMSYDPETGIICWKPRPELSNWWNEKFAGRPIGYEFKKGYMQITINQHCHFYHRVAWLLAHGEWPEATINHIDFDKTNNRLRNLEDVPAVINAMHCKSEVPSIYERFTKSGQRYWIVSLKIDGKWTNKRFYDYAEAIAARKILERELRATAYGDEPTVGFDSMVISLIPPKKIRPKKISSVGNRKTRRLRMTVEEIEALRSDPRSLNAMALDPSIPVGRNVLKKIRLGKINPKWTDITT